MNALRKAAMMSLICAAASQSSQAEPPAVDRVICTHEANVCAALIRLPVRFSPALQDWLARRQLQALPTQYQVIFITPGEVDPQLADQVQAQVLEALLSHASALSKAPGAASQSTPPSTSAGGKTP